MTSPLPSSPRKSKRTPWVVRILLAAMLAAAIGGGYCVYRASSSALHAEHVLHAAMLTAQLLDEYVSEHNGQWPRSWEDLEKLPPKKRIGTMFDWPKDAQEVQKYVTVDFTADPKKLAKQSAEEFDAVRPIGPYFPFRDSGPFQELRSTLRVYAL